MGGRYSGAGKGGQWGQDPALVMGSLEQSQATQSPLEVTKSTPMEYPHGAC